MRRNRLTIGLAGLLCLSSVPVLAWAAQDPIQHDAEHYVLLQQHEERWQQEDEQNADRSEKEVAGVPYEGIEGLRPETIALREQFFFAQKLAK